MCETWLEFACRPATLTSTVVLAGATVTVIVPAAPPPGSGLSFKMRPLGLEDTFDEVWTGRGRLRRSRRGAAGRRTNGERKHANHALTDVNPALHRVVALPLQVTGAGRELIPACSSSRLYVSGQRRAATAPQQKAEPGQYEERTDRAETGDEVIDGGHEVVGRVAQRGRKAPAVSFRGRRRSPQLSHGDADRAVGSVVIEILDLTLQLFDLSRDLADLILHRDDVVDVLRLGQQRKHRVV